MSRLNLFSKKHIICTFPLSKQYPDDFRIHAIAKIALARLGFQAEVLRIRLQCLTKVLFFNVSPLEASLIYILLGEQDKAIDIYLNSPCHLWTMEVTVSPL